MSRSIRPSIIPLFLLSLFIIGSFSVNAQLNYAWAQQGGGAGLDQGYDIAVDNNGNVYTTGVYEGDAVFTPTPGPGDTLFHTAMSDAFISKYDASGNYQWAIRIIGDMTAPGNQNQIPYAITTDQAGNVYITGRIDTKSDFDPSEAPGDTLYLYPDEGTAYIAKYDPNGQLIWAKNFGGSTYVQGSAIQVGTSGNIYLHGYFNGTADFDPTGGGQTIATNGEYDFYVAQYDNQGDLNWVNGFGAGGHDFAIDMVLNASEDIFICTRFEGTVDFDPGPGTTNLTSGGNSDPAIARFQSNGDLVWAKSITGPGTEYIFEIAVDANDNTAVTGYITDTADFDPSPNNHTLTSAGDQDGYLAHYDGNGNLNWAFNLGNATNDAGSTVAFNASGDVYLTGGFEGTIDLDPSAGTANFTATQREIYIAQYTSLGAYLWAGIIGGPDYDFANSAVTDPSGNMYLTGGFMGPNADMNPDTSLSGVNTLPGFGSYDVFTLKLEAATGCPLVTTPITEEICMGDSIFFGGEYLHQPGNYPDTLQTTMGCDSIVLMDLSVNPVYEDTLEVSICNGDSLLFGGEYLTQSGSYHDTLQTIHGCDSVLRLRLNVFSAYSDTLSETICPGDSFLFHGVYYNQPGLYEDSLQTATGCDSVVTLQLHVGNTYSDTIYATLCIGDSILFGGTYFFTGGLYRDTLLTSHGCDSVVTLDLTLEGHSSNTVTDSICPGDSVLFAGVYLSQAGVYYDTLQASNGCDSTVAFQLVVLNSFSDTISATICEGDSLLFGGTFYSNSGLYRDTLLTAAGCDSVITLQLDIINLYKDTLEISICEGDSIFFNGTYYSSTGSYSDSLQTVSGCDSIVTLQLQVLDTYSDTIFSSICEGDSLLFGGIYYSSAGSYQAIFQTSAGCDSVVMMVLSELPNYTDTIHAEICPGRSFLFGGNFYSLEGYYTDSLHTVRGCDSVMVLHLEVIESLYDTVSTSICQGETIFFGGHFLDSTGQYLDTLVSTGGCDSVVTMELTVFDTASTVVDTTIQQGDSILIGNDYISTAGTYHDTLVASNGCDSTVTYNVDVIIGMEQDGFQSLRLYPNPTEGQVWVKGLDAGARLHIYTIHGRLLGTHQLHKEAILDVSAWDKGVYLFHFYSADGTKAVKQVVVQ